MDVAKPHMDVTHLSGVTGGEGLDGDFLGQC